MFFENGGYHNYDRLLYLAGQAEYTGIARLSSDETANSKPSWFSIDGRRLTGRPATKGVYLFNGKKLVIK